MRNNIIYGKVWDAFLRRFKAVIPKTCRNPSP